MIFCLPNVVHCVPNSKFEKLFLNKNATRDFCNEFELRLQQVSYVLVEVSTFNISCCLKHRALHFEERICLNWDSHFSIQQHKGLHSHLWC